MTITDQTRAVVLPELVEASFVDAITTHATGSRQ